MDISISVFIIFTESRCSHEQTYQEIYCNPCLYHVTGVNTYEELIQVDLESAVTKYLLDAGMAENDILTLKEKLR